MIRRFLNDIRGNYVMLTVIAMVPIMGGLAIAVDYTELSRQRAGDDERTRRGRHRDRAAHRGRRD